MARTKTPATADAPTVESLARRLEELEERVTFTFTGLTERIANAQGAADRTHPVPALSEERLAERRKPTGELASLLGPTARPLRELIDALRQHDLEELRDGGVSELDPRGPLFSTLAAFNESGLIFLDAALRGIIVTFSKSA